MRLRDYSACAERCVRVTMKATKTKVTYNYYEQAHSITRSREKSAREGERMGGDDTTCHHLSPLVHDDTTTCHR